MPISYTVTTGVVNLPYDLPTVFANPPVTISELFRQLSYGELHDLKLGLDGVGNIKEDRRNQVVHFANEGLKKLHQKFELICSYEDIIVPVSSSPLVIPLNAIAIQVVSMILPSGNSRTFFTHPVPGEIFVFNRKISFPATDCAYTIQVTWQNRHPQLRYIESLNDLQQPIYLSTEMWSALRAYIAGEIYANMNTVDAKNSSMQYRARYKEICKEVEDTGGIPQGMLDNNTFDRRGFR